MVLRAAMLWLAGNPQAEGMVRRAPVSRPLVNRFVAGEDADTALATARSLHDRGLMYSLDLLGENAASEERAAAAGRAYLDLLEQLQTAGLPGNISIKLTMLGLDISDESAWSKLKAIVARADELGMFVRVDMEGSDYTERTLDLFRRIHDLYPTAVGIVLQSYLYRTDRDLDEMIERGARVRIVKGAYKEPETVAYPHKSDVDDAFRRHVERLLDGGNYPAIASHDPAVIGMAKGYALADGHRAVALRVSDAVRDCTRPAGRVGHRGVQHAGLRAVRDDLVPIFHAPVGRATGECPLHSAATHPILTTIK